METETRLLDVEIPGLGWMAWGTRLEEVASRFPELNTITRSQHPGRLEFASGECRKRSAIVSTQGSVCGYEAAAQLNFRDGRLCAVHYHFPLTQPGESEEFCAVVDCLRRKLTLSYGEPVMATTGSKGGVTLDYKWQADGLHVEVRACLDDDQLILLANDPKSCAWCQ